MILIEQRLGAGHLLRSSIYTERAITMIENYKDILATKAAWKAKCFRDRRSWISIAGHVYLRGQDCSALRVKVFSAQGRCQICHEPLADGEGDMDHIEGKRKLARCDCWRIKLADGSRHTNVQRVCSMFAPGSCHAEKHHRVLRFSHEHGN